MSQVVWTEAEVQQLLQSPAGLLAAEPWRGLIQSMGGLEAVYQRLRELPIKEKQQAILRVLTTSPGASVDSYCTLLHIHPATFYRHQRLLFQSLTTMLNAMSPSVGVAVERSYRGRQQLPAGLGDFCGREEETAVLSAAIRAGAPIVAIQGMGGVGKTELGVHIARAVIDLFPDAQILLALHGTRDQPMPVAQALQSVIRVFTNEKLSGDIEELLPIYRSCLHDKRVIILADDARDAEHVRALIPPVGNLLIITSRQRFVLPGVEPIVLECLPQVAAEALVQRICRRVSGEEAAQIVAATGSLPLALRTSGSILANTPALPIARYIERLADTRQRLAALRDPDDPQLDVAASLDLSYAALEPIDRYVLQQLSVLAASFSTAFALDITNGGQSSAAVEAALYSLLRRSLLIYSPQQERWQMHDLVRTFALRKAKPEDLALAQHQAVQATIQLVKALQNSYLQGGDEALASLDQFDRERAHSDAAWGWTLANAETVAGDEALVQLCVATQKFARLRYDYRHEREPQLRAALAAAKRLGDIAREGELTWYLGALVSSLGDIAQALECYQAAIALLNEADEAYSAARAQFDLAGAYFDLGGPDNFTKALAMWQESLIAFRRFDAPHHLIALCLNNIGVGYQQLGDLPMAIIFFEQAGAIAEANRDHLEHCRVLHNTGYLKMTLGDPQGALVLFSKALELAEQLGSREGEGIISTCMAEALAKVGDVGQARSYFEGALAIFALTHDRAEEAYARWHYGLFLVDNHERDRGLELMRACQAYYQEINHHDAANDAAIIARLEAGETVSAVLASPA